LIIAAINNEIINGHGSGLQAHGIVVRNQLGVPAHGRNSADEKPERSPDANRLHPACAQTDTKNDLGQARDRSALPEFLFPNYTDLVIRVNPEVEEMDREAHGR
jgi:hypothetical protein